MKPIGAMALLLLVAPLLAQTHKPSTAPHALEPDGPVAVFDTSAGRLTCRLYAKQAPATVAAFEALVNGQKDWTAADGSVQHGRAFYEGLPVLARSDALTVGDRAAMGLGSAGAGIPPEKTGLDFARGGRLAMVVANGLEGPSTLLFTVDPNLEYEKRAVVFGQCDEASVALAGKLTHELLAVDNHPDKVVVLRRVTIVQPGGALPEPAPPLENEAQLTLAPPPALPVPAPEPTGPTATIETTMGTFTCRLFDKEAPVAVANFVGLATGTKAFKNPTTKAEVRGKHFYDGLAFGRVLPDFMVQNADMPGDPGGGGDIGIKFANEIVPGLSFDRPGRLAYANSGPGTNASEFFITEHAVRRLDGNYTIFGQCDDASVKLVEAIAHVPRDAHNKPLKPVVIRKMTVTPVK